MKKNVDLLSGPIALSLTKLALPIMGTAFLQMAYNLIDMIWIGRVGSDAVAAVGVAALFIWLSSGIIMIPRIGGQIKVAQLLGAGDAKQAAIYAKCAIQAALLLGSIFGVITILFHGQMIAFFNMTDKGIVQNAEAYLIATCGLIIFNYLNQVFTGMWTAMGNSTITLKATLVGLAINVVLDPILIFGIGPVPELGVLGAGIATVFAQIIVFVVFLFVVKKDTLLFCNIRGFRTFHMEEIKTIVKIGFPAGLQSLILTSISMTISRMITEFGEAAIAVQKVGVQIESISWMTAEGFSTAVNALIAQNYGANQEKRVDKGYRTALLIMGIWGVGTSLALILFPEQLFTIFIQEEDLIPLGVDYLQIIGVSQLFMCVELATAGAFQGLGKTLPPSINGIVFTALRIPAAYLLVQTSLGLNGIWWAITLSSVVKGIVLPTWFIYTRHRLKRIE